MSGILIIGNIALVLKVWQNSVFILPFIIINNTLQKNEVFH